MPQSSRRSEDMAARGRMPDCLHPAVAGWFVERFGAPTAVQARAWQAVAAGENLLVAAPTGSGKTLAAFMGVIDELVREALSSPLPDAVRILYVSPLKSLSNDIERNLREPLAGIAQRIRDAGLPDPCIRHAVRTGDTPASERARMRRRPPQILVTTPESLYILLGSDAGRAMLSGVRSVIVDELHALAPNKRGAHLALSLERLAALAGDFRRIGLSATIRPVSRMAEFLAGRDARAPVIVDAGFSRPRDLALEVPRSPLSAVMAGEVWAEVYDRIAELARECRTTLVFVNQRRQAERVARHLGERLGQSQVASHHGSLAASQRQRAEQALKEGRLKVLVATASMELGIDVGAVDLVCQIGSPRGIAALLQRVGRSGHAPGAMPRGRLFPVSRADLLECTALLEAVHRGEMDLLACARAPLDVLAQQIVAEVAARPWPLDALYERLTSARPYRELARERFDAVVRMLAEGYDTRRGRRAAHLHLDAVNGIVRARRGAPLVALTNAGVIPDQFEYEVVLLPQGHRIGTLGEDFAFESLPGDIFQLGNATWRVRKVESGRVLVEDAAGEPPTVPFWFGEAPGRSDALSEAVCRLLGQADAVLSGCVEPADPAGQQALQAAFSAMPGVPPVAAAQLAEYLATARAALGRLPRRDAPVVERFFDEAGDQHLVIHAPLGSRILRAWGLALRKRFCRSFNFELQAAALEDSLILSLGPTHSFPLADIAGFLKSASAREVLVQALLDAPMFATHWRWCACTALAVRRHGSRGRTPPPIQRAQAEDLLAVVFPDQLACLENIRGDRRIPDHPLVQQTIDDCLHEVMDVDGLLALLRGIERGSVQLHCRDLTAPSPLAEAVLTARPWAFLDDGDAETRRTRAVRTTDLADLDAAAGLARLPRELVAEVEAGLRPELSDAETVHDALLIHGALSEQELAGAEAALAELREQRRMCWVLSGGKRLAVASERLPLWRALLGEQLGAGETVPKDEALVTLVRGRLEMAGPRTAADLAEALGLPPDSVRAALAMLEGEGAAMRGDPYGDGQEYWCERRVLVRLHRAARGQRRRQVRAVSPQTFQRFLFHWQRVLRSDADPRREGDEGVAEVLAQLEGWRAGLRQWRGELLELRVRGFGPDQIDALCAAGRIAWCGVPGARARQSPGSLPIRFVARARLSAWWQRPEDEAPSPKARRVQQALVACGALFVDELTEETGLLRGELEQALLELAGRGLVHCDSWSGLLALCAQRRSGRQPRGAMLRGRWALLRARRRDPDPGALASPECEHVARVLLARYGVVFRALIAREDAPAWRELFAVYRRLEARGEILGGRFVDGFSGEQFALPEAARLLAGLPAPAADGERVAISATDPLNLAGILLPGARVPAVAGNRLLFENGELIGTRIGARVELTETGDAARDWQRRRELLAGVRRPAAETVSRRFAGTG